MSNPTRSDRPFSPQTKRILSVGQCPPDHVALAAFLTAHFDAEVVPADGPEDVRAALDERDFHLVLVNRKLDRDYSDGLEIVRRLKADARAAHVPVMLVTNYPDHQEMAVAAGAERGFGKLEFGRPETLERLRRVLE